MIITIKESYGRKSEVYKTFHCHHKCPKAYVASMHAIMTDPKNGKV